MDKKGILKHKEVFNAWLEGKEIQEFNTMSEEWEEWEDDNDFEFRENTQYRIKDERKIIPFTEETIIPNLDRWIKNINSNDKCKIINYSDSGICVIDEFYDYYELLDKFVFVDTNEPCGNEIN